MLSGMNLGCTGKLYDADMAGIMVFMRFSHTAQYTKTSIFPMMTKSVLPWQREMMPRANRA
jgi:hypothetical protein